MFLVSEEFLFFFAFANAMNYYLKFSRRPIFHCSL